MSSQHFSIGVKLLTADAKVPQRGSVYAAGADLFASESCVIPVGSRKLVGTGIAVDIPSDKCAKIYLRIAPRSGLTVKYGIDVGAGVVDSDYRGEIKVCLINNGTKEFVVNMHDRIAQLITEQVIITDFNITEQISQTERGDGGFGSTGN